MPRNPKYINETRYTPQNPPNDEETAQMQIKHLQNEINSIEDDLEHQTVLAFHDQSEFEIWRRRATTAVTYKKREIRFLESWLNERVEARQNTARVHAGQELEERIRILTDAYYQRYSPVFGIDHPAEDLEEVKVRSSVLLAIQSQIDADLTQLQAVASKHGLERREMEQIEQPLRSVAISIKTELQYLRNVLRILDPAGEHFQEQDRIRSEQEILTAQRAQELAEEISNERPPPYNTDHLPTDVDAAKKRLGEIEKIRKKLESSIEELSHKWEREATTDTGLPKWTKQPLSQVRKSIDTESHILGQYIRDWNRKVNRSVKEIEQEPTTEEVSQNNQTDSRRALNDISQDIRNLASRLASEIQEKYIPVYSDEKPPKNAEEVEERLKEVTAVKARLQSAFSDITDAWCSHPLRREDLPSVKRPLVKILSKVEVEIAILKAFTSNGGSEKKEKYLKWKVTCVTALTRASFEGFTLTKEEQEVVKTLLADISRAHSED